jgi:hypothetical protein
MNKIFWARHKNVSRNYALVSGKKFERFKKQSIISGNNRSFHESILISRKQNHPSVKHIMK